MHTHTDTKTTRNRANRSVQSGFTLIEILLVVVIIGILAAVAIPNFSGIGDDARRNAAKQEISALETALRRYELDNGSYPDSLDALVNKPGNAPNWNGPYMDSGKIPKDPWDNQYQYTYPGKVRSHNYDLASLGPDGTPSDDDVTNYDKQSSGSGGDQ